MIHALRAAAMAKFTTNKPKNAAAILFLEGNTYVMGTVVEGIAVLRARLAVILVPFPLNKFHFC